MSDDEKGYGDDSYDENNNKNDGNELEVSTIAPLGDIFNKKDPSFSKFKNEDEKLNINFDREQSTINDYVINQSINPNKTQNKSQMNTNTSKMSDKQMTEILSKDNLLEYDDSRYRHLPKSIKKAADSKYIINLV